MNKLQKYLDKPPYVSYSMGPTGLGVNQSGIFNDEWFAYFKKGFGACLSKGDAYNPESSTSLISGTNEILFTESFSFSFDSGSRIYAAFENFDSISVMKPSGASHQYLSFSGRSPQLFYNSLHIDNQFKKIYCFYLRQDGKICSRYETDDFSSEFLVYEPSLPLYRINQVLVSPSPYFLRFSIIGLTEDGYPLHIQSEKFEPLSYTAIQNYNLLPTGDATITGIGFKLEERYINLLSMTFAGKSFSTYETGIVSGGFNDNLLLNKLIIGSDSFETSPTGTINYLIGTNNMSGGFFIYG